MWGSDKEKKEFGILYPLFYDSQEERNYVKAIKVIKKLLNMVIPVHSATLRVII
jgi:hypothetical protein